MRSILLLLLFSIVSCTQVKKKDSSPNNQEANQSTIEVPTLRINKDKFTSLKSEYFQHSVGGTDIDQRTLVSMKYDQEYLILEMTCLDNPWVDQNYYKEHNEPLFNQEVFEVFIAQGEEAPEHYWEFQVNPNGAVFSGKVSNTYRSSQKFSMKMVDPTAVGIEANIDKNSESELWKGVWKIPLDLISDKTKPMIFRMNMYRIVSKTDHLNADWSCNETNSVFACWNSTQAEKPSFHRPDYFGYLIFE